VKVEACAWESSVRSRQCNCQRPTTDWRRGELTQPATQASCARPSLILYESSSREIHPTRRRRQFISFDALSHHSDSARLPVVSQLALVRQNYADNDSRRRRRRRCVMHAYDDEDAFTATERRVLTATECILCWLTLITAQFAKSLSRVAPISYC